MTPEGKIKNQVKKLLSSVGPELDQMWYVQNGMGSPALDCVVCYRGFHCEIETKAPGKKPTARQEVTIAKRRRAGSYVFVIAGEADLAPLKQWLAVAEMLPAIHVDQ